MNDTSTRRLKLFNDAEHYGAEIIKNDKWIAAICKDYNQVHCFGRGKPKVVAGTNEIDQNCNLRDDEGISDENRVKRDSYAPYVKDNIGFDEQQFEAGWCVMGGNFAFPGSTLKWGPDLEPCESYKHVNLYCQAKEKNETCPLITFLELETGKIYISNARYEGPHGKGMLDLGDGWAIDDFNNERNGYNEGGIAKKIKADAGFADICQKAFEKSFEGMTDAPTFNLKEQAEKHEEIKSWVPYQNNGVSVLKFYTAIYDQLIKDQLRPNEIPIVLSYQGNYYKLKAIKEGRGSCLVFDVKGSMDQLTVKDFIDYIVKRIKDDGKYRSKPVQIQLKHRVANIKNDIKLKQVQSISDHKTYKVIAIKF